MRVRIKHSLSGLDFSYKKNDEIELKSEKAKLWIKAGVAEEIKENKKKTKGVKSKVGE